MNTPSYTKPEIQRAISSTLVLAMVKRVHDFANEQNCYALAYHVLARMYQAQRLDIVMSYEEARISSVWIENGDLTAPPVAEGVDSMVRALSFLHGGLGIFNHAHAHAMDLFGFIEQHWGVTPEIEPEVVFNERTPMTFRIDPLHAEVNLMRELGAQQAIQATTQRLEVGTGILEAPDLSPRVREALARAYSTGQAA